MYLQFKMKSTIFILLLFFSNASFSEGIEEPLYGVIFDSGSIGFHVYSEGCTEKESFKLETALSASSPPLIYLTLKRVKPDSCNVYIPDGKVIIYKEAEVSSLYGFKNIIVKNRFRFHK